jgi:hypothetical protein
MKNSLYIIAGLLIVIWLLIVIAYKPFGILHLLIVAAGLIILFRIVFNKKLINK